MHRACDLSAVTLRDVFYVDSLYSQKHAHMLHAHTDILELLYIANGEGRYTVGGREYAVHPGNLIVCNANTLHGEAPFQAHTIQTYCCALAGVQIAGLPTGALLDARHCPVFTLHSDSAQIGRIMPSLYALHTSDAAANRAVCHHLAMSVLLLALRAIQQPDGDTKEELKKEALVRQITAYLDQHYTEPLTLEQISAALHISPSHLSHLFKRETGLSPMRYLLHRRIGEAQSLLMETALPIHTIEEQLGFGSSCHFTTAFKKYVGIAPREYRRHFHTANPK